MLDLRHAQSRMQKDLIDAWVIYDFRGSNPVLWQVIGGKKSTTRRSFLVIPAGATPRLLAHTVDKEQFSEINVPAEYYVSWEDMQRMIREMLRSCHKVAMEYSPNGSIPTMSWVDGGTLELIRSLGMEVISSADLFQSVAAAWSDDALKSHLEVTKIVNAIKDKTFAYIAQTIRSGASLTEYDAQEFIMREFERRHLETEDRPIVAVNANSGNPHYEPTAQMKSEIRRGDWVLIDLWARFPGEQNVFSDITWVGYMDGEVPIKYQAVFNIVREARDLVVEHLKEAWDRGANVEGWELDMIARNHIQRTGHGQHFLHRTGHNLGPGPSLHALGVNLDNLETHDTRRILVGSGFSVEPGIYLPDFGVRLEINVYVSEKGPIVTTPVQNEIVKLE